MRHPGISLRLSALLLYRTLSSLAAAAEQPSLVSDPDPAAEKSSPPACTASSAALIYGGFFDLRPDMAVAPAPDSASESRWARRSVSSDYRARGFDYGANFTLNLCGPVVEPVSGVDGLEEAAWVNVSAYYTMATGQIVSIGQASMDLVSRGRMLVLTYTDGSPCSDPTTKAQRTLRRDSVTAPLYDHVSYRSAALARLRSTAQIPRNSVMREEARSPRRKSTILSFHCDRDPTLHQASVSFVGTPDQCAYFFDVRTPNACPRSESTQVGNIGSIGPGSVFALIFGIAVIVYVLGGVFYNRTVAHVRGWRQLPNYSLWAAVWNSITTAFFRVFSFCVNLMPQRRGYRFIPNSPGSRSRNREDENRLIDQLDEEWDDQ